ncbi:related to Zn(II)2Cys6 transcriptional activator [Cephalotrichum gorgonifer]|uniref:Related to Zn(II)2Cys6 transcriptional activator n=1 Tax=Cephalotrichum gorgonifer TaxID=2041049 RepID=A0AAE8MVE6_9PEZI|nr:related to Zn(II)2Cys6 transcriptional activator [Cephalotrichum gorgonifer]
MESTTVGSAGAKEDGSKRTLSCYQCKGRKLKCDRTWPCSRCTRLGDECRFPESRLRPAKVVRGSKVKALEARLVDLEHRFKSVGDGHRPVVAIPTSASTSASPPDTQLLQAGRLEQLPPQALVDELTGLYFSKLYPETPMQDPARYLASLHMPVHMQPPMCLQYTILALAASFSFAHQELAQALYKRARNYIQFDEMKDDDHLVLTLGHVQCWVLLSHFEAKHLWFTRASMSLSRAARLAQMLGLHDAEASMPAMSMAALAPPRNWSESEERRRTMWAIFSTDRLTSSTTGWPVVIESDRIKTPLPASDESFRTGVEEPLVTLNEALRDASLTVYSPFACRVLVAHLYHECLDHTFKTYPEDEGDGKDPSSGEFWRNHQRLDDRLERMFTVLPESLCCPQRLDSQLAVSVNLSLYTAIICIHRSLTARARRCKAAAGLIFDSNARMHASAGKVFDIVARAGDIDTMFYNPFVAFASFMAAMVFLDDYSTSHSNQSEGYLKSLMNLLVLIAENNPMTASLTVQLAYELERTGIDPSAPEKVSHLAAKLGPDPVLMGHQDHSTGGTVFCLLEPQPRD